MFRFIVSFIDKIVATSKFTIAFQSIYKIHFFFFKFKSMLNLFSKKNLFDFYSIFSRKGKDMDSSKYRSVKKIGKRMHRTNAIFLADSVFNDRYPI